LQQFLQNSWRSSVDNWRDGTIADSD
jgi:hypothetical protein